MRWSGVLLALLLVFVGGSARQDVADSGAGSGLSASVSAVHVLSVPSPDACWALCRTGEWPPPPHVQALPDVGGEVAPEVVASGRGSIRAPPRDAITGSADP
ncbi:hypothetical protein [Lentzea sp. NPDC004782]|uniref:hypothetical protein n=1 Tax=Lentzea sp. NPDC004782 TaxID=3154458 RepID=UPI0033A26F2B